MREESAGHRTGAQPANLEVEGFSLLRTLSDRDRSKVFLARDRAGALAAVKLQLPADSRALPGILARYGRLQPLTTRRGLLPILSYGIASDGWLWESLPLADNLPGLPPLTEHAGLEQYTPVTLRTWTTEQGPASATQVAKWGIRLAGSLNALHEAGLVHRDVKPTNVLFVQGEPCLADYGLVGEPGGAIDFSGTEGFQPLEGTSDVAADLFALGKTLYESWTAGDRLEFPSVPRAVLDSPEWDAYGSHLNKVILRACHAQPRQRFRSAAEVAEALSNVLFGQRPLNRRRWLAAVTGAVTVTAGTLVLSRIWRPPARVVWRRVREKGFAVEDWLGHAGTVDWKRRRMYSLTGNKKECWFQSLDLDSFELPPKKVFAEPKESCSTILHPETGQLWAIEGGRGEVFALDPDAGVMSRLGGGPYDERHYLAKSYWNPVTSRVGVFGGYGWFAMRNDRSEFDVASGRWIELEPDRRGTDLCPRVVKLPLMLGSTGRRIYLLGGSGSPSGEQGKRVPGLRGFDSQFYYLDDIWELNLESSSWRQILPLGHFDPDRLRAAVYHPVLKGLLIFEGIPLGNTQRGVSSVWLFRPDIDQLPVKLRMSGQISDLAMVSACALDPLNNEVLVLAEDGIFRVIVEPI